MASQLDPVEAALRFVRAVNDARRTYGHNDERTRAAEMALDIWDFRSGYVRPLRAHEAAKDGKRQGRNLRAVRS